MALVALTLGVALLGRRAESKPPPPPPPTLSPEALRGGELYGRMCAVCHGPAGEGYAADQAPRLASQEFLSTVSDDYLREAIAHGRRGTTMSAWLRLKGGPLKPEDIIAVIAFIRGWQHEPSAKLDNRPLQGNIQRGTALYAAQCAKCHGERGVGGPEMHIGGAELLATASDGFLRAAIRNGRPGTQMQGFQSTLSAQQIDDVIAALRSFQAPTAGVQVPLGPAPLPLGPVPLNPQGPEPEGFKAYGEMTPADVIHAQLKRGARFVIMDARVPSDYLREHISGAVSVPFYDPSPYFKDLPKDTWLVAYCGCPHAESGQLAEKLQAQGFNKVAVLDEGLGYWKAHGYPITLGPADPASQRRD
ncbi:MAG: c-type cytochrome [Deltaproteobacteria bacterium]|nr:c-type cytochrome [Deltaproteobacteria bacterium]